MNTYLIRVLFPGLMRYGSTTTVGMCCISFECYIPLIKKAHLMHTSCLKMLHFILYSYFHCVQSLKRKNKNIPYTTTQIDEGRVHGKFAFKEVKAQPFYTKKNKE